MASTREIFSAVSVFPRSVHLQFNSELVYETAVSEGLNNLVALRPEAMAEFLADINVAARKLLSHLDSTQEQRPMQIYMPFELADSLVKMSEATGIDIARLVSLKLSEGVPLSDKGIPLRQLTPDEQKRLSKYKAIDQEQAAPAPEAASPDNFLVSRKDIAKKFMFVKRSEIQNNVDFADMDIRLSESAELQPGEVILKHLTIVADTDGRILTKFDEINSVRDIGSMFCMTAGDCHTGVELNGGNLMQLKIAMCQDMAQSVLDDLVEKYNWQGLDAAPKAKLHEALAHSFLTSSPQAFFYIQEGHHGVDINPDLINSFVLCSIVQVDASPAMLAGGHKFIDYDVENINDPKWINPMSHRALACFSVLEELLERTSMTTIGLAVQRAYMRMLNAPAVAQYVEDVEASSN